MPRPSWNTKGALKEVSHTKAAMTSDGIMNEEMFVCFLGSCFSFCFFLLIYHFFVFSFLPGLPRASHFSFDLRYKMVNGGDL